MIETLFTALAWLLKALVTAVLPVAAITALAVLVGLVRTTALIAVFPLLVAAVAVDRATTAAGHAVPAPRFPRIAEVTAR